MRSAAKFDFHTVPHPIVLVVVGAALVLLFWWCGGGVLLEAPRWALPLDRGFLFIFAQLEQLADVDGRLLLGVVVFRVGLAEDILDIGHFCAGDLG